MANDPPLLRAAAVAAFVWPLLWFVPSAFCGSAPLIPFADAAGEWAQILRVFASPLALGAGLSVGSAVWSGFGTLAGLVAAARSPDSLLRDDGPPAWGQPLAAAALCVTYIAVYTAFGLLTGLVAGAVVGTTLAYGAVAILNVGALMAPFALLALLRRIASA